jgi:hypothetical protein
VNTIDEAATDWSNVADTDAEAETPVAPAPGTVDTTDGALASENTTSTQ